MKFIYEPFESVVLKANTGADAIKRAPIVIFDSGVKCARIQDISQRKEFNNWGFCKIKDADYERFSLKKGYILIGRVN